MTNRKGKKERTTTARDSIGLFADTFVDPFAHVTIREHELLGASGNTLDYFAVKGTTAIDFRADNDVNFKSLEKYLKLHKLIIIL